MDLLVRSKTHQKKFMIITFATHLLFYAECSLTGCSYSSSTVVKCVNKHLTKIPSWIPSNVTDLDLSENPSLKLQEDSFVRFTNLVKLSLRYCNLNQPLELPNSLQNIDLAYNSFSMENVTAIFKRKQESRITSINLRANNLKLDGKLSFFPKSIQYLWLNANTLKKIERDDFKFLKDVKYLNLANNGLHSIERGAFDELKQLTRVLLYDNNITELPKEIFQFNPKIDEIDMENNYLKDIPDLSGIIHLTMLSLNGNRIMSVNGHSLGCKSIYHADLAWNKIESFNFSGVTYTILDLSNNRLSDIERGSLGKNPFLTALLLQRNNITSLTKASFQGVHFISELHLQSNNLQKIEKGAFSNMVIEKLLLFNNSLSTMNGALDGMKVQPHLLLLFGNPNISFMRTSDYQNMTGDSKIYISCHSIKMFSSPFMLKGQLTCSPSSDLVLVSSFTGLQGNGFKCDKGKSSGSYNCYPCKPGEYDANMYHNHIHCLPCPYGAFYQDEIASTDCKKCPVGQYVPPDKGPGKSPLDCKTCPKGTNTNTSAGYRACPCLPGYSRKYRFGACEKCTLEGFQCRKDYPELIPGYWMSWSKIKSCKDSFISFISNLDATDNSYDRGANYFKCNLPTAQKCPIAKSCNGGVDASCYKGYTGVLCAVCDSGYMKQFNKCVECSSPVVSVTECIAYFMSFVILCWLMSKLDNINLVGEGNRKNERTFADLIQSSLKIVMGFYQVLVRIITAFSSIQWPSTLTHAMKAFEFVELSVLRIPSLHCIRSDWRLNAISEFWISLIAMASIPSLLLIYYALRTAISYFCISQQHFRRKRMISLKNCLQSIVLFFFATYPFISTKIFHVLPASCHTFCTAKENGQCINKISYLRNDYRVECSNSTVDRNFNMTYGYVSLLIPIGFPLLLLYLLCRFAPRVAAKGHKQRHLNFQCEDSYENEEQCYVEWKEYNTPLISSGEVNPEEISIASFALKMTYGNYKTSCWYWEFIEMIRKLVMVTASSFLLENVKIGLYSNILLSILFVVLHARKWPMKDLFDNYMQLLALVSVTINLCYSVTKTSSIGDSDIIESEKDVFGLGLMLVCLNSLLLILIVGRFVKEVVLKVVKKVHGGCCVCCCNSTCCNLQHGVERDEQLVL